MDYTGTFSRTSALKKRGGSIGSILSSIASKIPIGSIVNRTIDALPIELHLPGGYQYCGPGTKLQQRLAKGDPGINKLDQACKEHDIAYSKYSDTTNRSIADRVLAEKAWQRVKSSEASLGERAAALAVAAGMKAKTAIGGGRRKRASRRNKHRKRGGNIRRKRRTGNKKNSELLLKLRSKYWRRNQSGKGLYLRPYQRVY